MRVIIIGSGIAGLSAAIALRKVGIDVAVYERAPELREVGAGISLWANALRALDYIGTGESVRKVSLKMTRSEIRAKNGFKVQMGFTRANWSGKPGCRRSSAWSTAPTSSARSRRTCRPTRRGTGTSASRSKVSTPGRGSASRTGTPTRPMW